ncbi:olfactory receptor 51G2-like [Ambystoma mexicanum]|uniref:olfactory receptor 51G2-like n=1 Tax=Ambystoma mexicanum TaxID=8296 RepID=UPI0037E8B91D
MSKVDSNSSRVPSLLLMGFLGTDDINIWISIPLCLFYLLALGGNGLIVFLIKTDSRLGEPMYLFLLMLSATDVGMNLTTLPTVLSVLWLDSRNINFYACLTQMYFIHSLTSMGSAILVAMAFDRYLAVCNPLRYVAILNPMVAKIEMAAVVRGVCIMIPQPFFLSSFLYCENNKLYHPFCFFPDVMKLACTDTTIGSSYGLFVVAFTFCLDAIMILFSYLMILKTVLSIASKEECLKALSTCVSHICVVLIFYIPLIGLTFAQRYAKSAPPLLPVFMGLAYIFIPPVLNPMIYSLKTRQIQKALKKHFWVETRRQRKVDKDSMAEAICAVNPLELSN